MFQSLSLVAVSLVLSAAPVLAGPLSFHHTPADIKSICDDSLGRLKSSLDAVATQDPKSATFATAVLPMEAALAEFSNRISPVTFLKDVSVNADVRAAAEACEERVQQFYVDLYAREDLYAVVKAADGRETKLNAEDRQLLDEYLIGFQRNGLDLPEAERAKFLDLKKRLLKAELEFARNIAEYKDELLVTREELEGVPQGFIDRLEKTAEGKYRLQLDYPTVDMILANAKVASTRAQLEAKFASRGGKRNIELLEEAVQLRHQMAQMLGYENHAALVLSRRMAKAPSNVDAFLDRLIPRLQPLARQELAEMLELKRKETGNPAVNELVRSDISYYANQLRKQKYNVDPEVVREYFPFEKVMSGMFLIYERLLGVKFVPVEPANAWHESVKLYRIERDGKLVAHFYADLFPRANKYSHAAAFTLNAGYVAADGTYVPPVSAIVANFTAPTPEKPSLLSHGEVETLFHEFGHIVHQTLTTARYATFSGTSVKRDFVEAPSQMLENWVWDPEMLKLMSGHYKDPSKPLPAELIEKMIRAKRLNVALATLRQIGFGKIDLAYHTSDKVDSTAVYHKLLSSIGLVPVTPGTYPQASFGHLMGGYDAGYYGYLWSEVFAQDLFSRFEKEGLLSERAGADYLRFILQPGGSRDPMDLIRAFLGREPNEEAFLKSLGLTPQAAACSHKLVQ